MRHSHFMRSFLTCLLALLLFIPSTSALVLLPAKSAHAQSSTSVSDLHTLPGGAQYVYRASGDLNPWQVGQSVTITGGALTTRRSAFYEGLAAARPKDQKFLQGWRNRVADLVKAVKKSLGAGAACFLMPLMLSFVLLAGSLAGCGAARIAPSPSGQGTPDAMGNPAPGFVAGKFISVDGNAPQETFVYQNGTLRDLGTVSPYGSVTGVNSKGQVVGSSTFGERDIDGRDSPAPRAFFYDGTSVRDLKTLGGERSAAIAINEVGQIVGTSQVAGGSVYDHAFLYENGAMRDIGALGSQGAIPNAINNKGQIVGKSQTSGGNFRAFIYENGAMRDVLPGVGTFGDATDINDSGQIVGDYYNNANHAFVMTNGVMTDLNQYDTLPNTGCHAVGINNKGQILMEIKGTVVGSSSAFRLVVLTPSAT